MSRIGRAGIDATDSIRGVYTLVVDTDARRRSRLTAVHRYCGAYVQTADTSARALDLIQQVRPDVLVAEFGDVGHRLIRELRARHEDGGGLVPAIALGARSAERTARAWGYNAFVAVPFVPWELCRLVGAVTSG